MRVRGGALVLVLGLSLGIAGCSAEAEPTPLPPVPSASPSPTPLAVPPEAMAETAEGASAFAEYFLDVVNKAFASGDAAPVRRLSHPDCGTCNNLIAAIERGPKPGQRVSGGDYKVLAAVTPGFDGGDVIVDIRYALTEAQVFDLSGKLIKTTPANPGVDAQMLLLPDSGGWVVRGFRNIS